MAKQKLTFEGALEKLEKLVSQIEQGEVTLEESIEKYAEGIKLIKQCRTTLDAAEKRIQLLAKGQGESLEASVELEEPEQEAAG